MADKTATVTLTHDGAVAGTVTATLQGPAGGLYTLPADRTYAWNPGLNAVGGIPHRTTVYRTISPSGADDSPAIQAALDSCPSGQVVQLTAGTFRINSGSGLQMSSSNITLRGTGPGTGGGAGAGTFLIKPAGTNSSVIQMGNDGTGTATKLTSDALRGSSAVTVASTAGLAAGELVVINEVTDAAVSHWNGGVQSSGWFEEPNRPLGEIMEIASIAGSTVTFTTPFSISLTVANTAHLAALPSAMKYSGVEDLYVYGGEAGDQGGNIHFWGAGYCWVKHVESNWSGGAAIHVDHSFRCEIRDSFLHDSNAGLHAGGASYGIGLNWYTSHTLIENTIVIRFNKILVMRSCGGGNVVAYSYADDGADSGGSWFETVLNSGHMTTPHHVLFEGNQGANFDQDDTWGNSVYITVFRNHLTGHLRDYPSSGPRRAAGVTQWHWWQSFVGNVLGPSPLITGYESITRSATDARMWMVGYQKDDSTADGGKCMATLLRDGNFDYFTGQVHWHGIGGTGQANGLTPPATSTLPASLYLSARPAFFGSNPWPWVDGSSAAGPLPGTLPARARYDAGTPNAI